MSYAKPNKTKERILQISLQLFNERGERSVTTNHIAAELAISPGNLYYHFRNKQEIIKELAQQYQRETLEMLAIPTDRPLNSNDKINYFNLGGEDRTSVSDIAKMVIAAMNLEAKIKYTGGDRGWVGDVPRFNYDLKKIHKLSFKDFFSIRLPLGPYNPML